MTDVSAWDGRGGGRDGGGRGGGGGGGVEVEMMAEAVAAGGDGGAAGADGGGGGVTDRNASDTDGPVVRKQSRGLFFLSSGRQHLISKSFHKQMETTRGPKQTIPIS